MNPIEPFAKTIEEVDEGDWELMDTDDRRAEIQFLLGTETSPYNVGAFRIHHDAEPVVMTTSGARPETVFVVRGAVDVQFVDGPLFQLRPGSLMSFPGNVEKVWTFHETPYLELFTSVSPE